MEFSLRVWEWKEDAIIRADQEEEVKVVNRVSVVFALVFRHVRPLPPCPGIYTRAETFHRSVIQVLSLVTAGYQLCCEKTGSTVRSQMYNGASPRPG